MADNELHYVELDPDELWSEIENAYYDEGGDLLYPGDEKEMLLRAVQAIAMSILGTVDNALRMDTLTYAVRDYLKEYGKKRNCIYMEAVAATAGMTVTMAATGYARTVPAGTTVTADGAVMYELTEDLELTGAAQTIETTIQCTEAGTVGNGLIANTYMQFTEGLDGLVSAVITTAASGGMDAEDEEEYRERIRTYGLATVTTGPAAQYESLALSVSSEILDAAALDDGDGEVGIYLITETGASTETIYAEVLEKLSAKDTRPLTDHVSVYGATDKAYTLNVKIWYDSGRELTQTVADTIAEYQKWQDNKVGRAFNPDRLTAMLYQSGCERVQYIDGSSGIDSGEIEYTEIPARARCKGTITPTIVNT